MKEQAPHRLYKIICLLFVFLEACCDALDAPNQQVGGLILLNVFPSLLGLKFIFNLLRALIIDN